MAATAASLPRVVRLDPASFVGGPRKTAQYRRHALSGDWYGAVLDGRPWLTWREVDRMRRDPRVQLGLRIIRAPLYQVRVKVEADKPLVAKFVQQQFQDIWDDALRQYLRFLEYGVSAGETTYRTSRGRVVYDRFDDVHPRDALPLEWSRGPAKGQLCGVRVTGAAEGGGTFDLRLPHAFWFSGEAEYGAHYGPSRLAGAQEPWLEKRGRHGAVDCRRLWFKKGSFSGGSIRYPLGWTEVDNGDGTSTRVNNQDLAREIVEKFEAGGVLALPNTTNAKGEFLWIFEYPKPLGEVGNILEYPKDLDNEILQGMGVPPELVEASTVGSGYSGRSIPAQMFFTSEDEIVRLLIKTVDRQKIKPMVYLNFGPCRYKIRAASLAAMVAKDPAEAGKLTAQEPDPRQAVGGGVFVGNTPGGNQKIMMPGGQVTYRQPGGVRLSHGSAKLVRKLNRLEKRLRLSWEEGKHPRANDGRFGAKPGEHGGSDGSPAAGSENTRGHGDRHKAIRAQLEALKTARREAVQSLKADSEVASARGKDQAAKARALAGQLAFFVVDDDAPDNHVEFNDRCTDLDSLSVDFDPDGSLSEQFSAVGEMLSVAKEAAAISRKMEPYGQGDDAFTREMIDENTQTLGNLVDALKGARQAFREYARHRREIAAIRRNEDLEG